MSTLDISKEHFIWRVKLNRPDKRNAFHPEMIKELHDFFTTTVNSDPYVRGVLLTGNGPSFCAGADLDWMKSMAQYNLQQNQEDAARLYAMFEAIANCPLPVIGLLHGYVMGGGVGLAAVCDIAMAESSTKFCFSEVKIGIVPAVISGFVLRKMVPSKARELMITGRMFDADVAAHGGLIEFAGRELELKNYLEQTIECLAAAAPGAVREAKKLLRSVRGLTDAEARDLTVKTIAGMRVAPEGQEGMRSFLEKRDPSWKLQIDSES